MGFNSGFKGLSRNAKTDVRPIVNRYIATSIWMYAHDCNRTFYNTYVLSFCTSEKKPMSVRPQNKDVH